MEEMHEHKDFPPTPMQSHPLRWKKVKRRISWWKGCQPETWESWISTPAQPQACCLALHKSLKSHMYNGTDISGSWKEVYDTELGGCRGLGISE